ncbi:MAG: hypothetical protein KHZ77_02085 [Veillonella sp.]|uniref:LPO_1073/Vpar_1526 family protein n=1 Tax=Veillonella sp. TaxID=1926307 RepID=UPI0025E6038F|nr:LPO_1073/Vpar_1526 family protein [Veillonella sp.]MBS4912938.1 hypothetical protein [Veillonella sp.]
MFRESPEKAREKVAAAREAAVADSDYYNRRRRVDYGAEFYREEAQKHEEEQHGARAGHSTSAGTAAATVDTASARTSYPSTDSVSTASDVTRFQPGRASTGTSNVSNVNSSATSSAASIEMTQPMVKGWGHDKGAAPKNASAGNTAAAGATATANAGTGIGVAAFTSATATNETVSDNELTRRIQPVKVQDSETATDATIIMPRISHAMADTAGTSESTINGGSVSGTTAAATVATTEKTQSGGMDELVDFGTKHFIASFGILNDETKELVRQITAEALLRLGITARDELRALLENIVVQEALFGMQKAYVTSPLPWMKETAIMAFMDVVQEPKSSTPYLLAFDALRILPHLHLGHFQIMALALLLQYSRNSNNYNLEHFKHYVGKYIEPFLSELPREEFMYNQLDYLRCCALEPERTTLGEIFCNSYPYVFNYDGFTREELERALQGQMLEGRFVVKSLMSNRLKLAVADEGLMPRYFRSANIQDHDVQTRLLQLAQSRPISYKKNEFYGVLEKISPLLPKLAEVYDSMPISTMSLTLLGLYLGKAHVKITIGEDFDLTPWY